MKFKPDGGGSSAGGPGGGDLLAANNLSDLDDAGDARDNLGLGDAALEDVGAFDAAGDATAALIAAQDYTDTLDATAVHKAGTETITGAKTFSAGITLGAALAMGGFKVTNVADGTAANDAVNFGQLQAVQFGLDQKPSVVAASTANLNLASMPATVDGATVPTGKSFLAKDQSTASQNGLYVYNGAGAAATRRTDADASAEVTLGLAVYVESGTANAGTGWALTAATADPIVVGTSGLTFTQVYGPGSYLAGTGLVLTGRTFSPDFGTGAGKVVQGNDAKLTDDRTASGLRNASGIVTVSAATAPSSVGQALRALSATTAAWGQPDPEARTDITILVRFRADTGVTIATGVSSWAPKFNASGFSNAAVQATGGAQPTVTSSWSNGKPALTFNGSKYLQTTAWTGAAVTQPYTIYVVGRAASNGFYQFTDGLGASDRCVIGYGSPANTLMVGAGSTVTFVSKLNGYKRVIAAQMINHVNGGPNGNLFSNGQNVSEVSNSNFAISTHVPTGFTIGADYTFASKLNGDIAEIMLCSGMHTDNQIEQISWFYKDYYGI